jgi:xylulokinase
MTLSLGTSGVVFGSTDRPLYEPGGRVHAFCHAVPGRWHMMSVMLSAAGSLRWFRDALAPDMDFGDLVASAEEVPAGSEGLIFLPYLTGERSPHPDPLARGAFVGLTVTHDRRHMTRAVLEGVAFGLRDGLDLMTAAGMPVPHQIRASGGGTASQLWRQILADVLETEIATVGTSEGAAYGAGLLAAVGAGWYPTAEAAVLALVTAAPVANPGPNASAYAEAHAIYRDLYPALAPAFTRM